MLQRARESINSRFRRMYAELACAGLPSREEVEVNIEMAESHSEREFWHNVLNEFHGEPINEG